MSQIYRTPATVSLAFLAALGVATPIHASELDDLRASVQAMQKNMEQMQKKINQLEQENRKQKQQASTSKPAAAPAEGPVTSPSSTAAQAVTIAPTAVTIEGHPSQVTQRPSMNDQQEAAPRPNDLTLDPKYRGFVPIPNTPVLIKFNAKPRLDI